MASHSFFSHLHYVGVGVSYAVVLPCTCIVKQSGGVCVIHLLFVSKTRVYEAVKSLLQKVSVLPY